MKRERDNKLPLHLLIIGPGHLNAFKIWLLLNLGYKNENLKVREINKFCYEIGETVHNHKNSIFRSSL